MQNQQKIQYSEKKMLKTSPKQLTKDYFSKKFWQQLSPNLCIEKEENSKTIGFLNNDKKLFSKKIIDDGFLHLKQPGLETPTCQINQAICSIVKMGLPPVFIFIYDQPWSIPGQIKNILKGLLDDNYLLLPDFWAWHVSPGESGWKPHRDRPLSLFDDFTPQSLTLWIPLTKATPENSCMYVLPANKDLFYHDKVQPDLKFGFPGNLSDIQALPSEPNDVLIWNQRVVHWGSTSKKNHEIGPRISLAFEFQRSDVNSFNDPLIKPCNIPNFKERLNLIGKQVIQYTHMYGFNKELVDLAVQLKNFK